MLDAAGVEYESARPDLDEEQLKALLGDSADLAGELAAAKAMSISDQQWVIGSDSIVKVGEHRFSKPANRDEAARHLRYFSGKTMVLTSAVALARSGKLEWS